MVDAPEVHARPFWFGPEVEGVLRESRPFTVILRSPEICDIPRVLAERPQHAFICETFDDWSWLQVFMQQFSGPVTVAVEADDYSRLVAVKALPQQERICVILRYWADAPFDLLTAGDQISVGAPFDLLAFPVEAGARTRPEDYAEDH